MSQVLKGDELWSPSTGRTQFSHQLVSGRRGRRREGASQCVSKTLTATFISWHIGLGQPQTDCQSGDRGHVQRQGTWPAAAESSPWMCSDDGPVVPSCPLQITDGKQHGSHSISSTSLTSGSHHIHPPPTFQPASLSNAPSSHVTPLLRALPTCGPGLFPGRVALSPYCFPASQPHPAAQLCPARMPLGLDTQSFLP